MIRLLIQWGNKEFCFVEGKNKAEVFSVLDEEGDPTGSKIMILPSEGPIRIDIGKVMPIFNEEINVNIPKMDENKPTIVDKEDFENDEDELKWERMDNSYRDSFYRDLSQIAEE
jgi:hypothetical protein